MPRPHRTTQHCSASHCLLCLGLELPPSDTPAPPPPRPPPPPALAAAAWPGAPPLHALAATQPVGRVSCPCHRRATEAGATADCRTTTLPCHWTVSSELVFPSIFSSCRGRRLHTTQPPGLQSRLLSVPSPLNPRRAPSTTSTAAALASALFTASRPDHATGPLSDHGSSHR